MKYLLFVCFSDSILWHKFVQKIPNENLVKHEESVNYLELEIIFNMH